MANRSSRGKKSNVDSVKVAVVGAPAVGKSALSVRFVTRRYIGEYKHDSDCLYPYEAVINGEKIPYEVLDMCTKNIHELPPLDILQWANALVLVYSITDRLSFNYIRRVKNIVRPETTLTLIGNKADMVHLRQVSTEEGEILAKDFECNFAEVAAAEQVVEIGNVFLELGREVVNSWKKPARPGLFDRMLGARHTSRAYSRGKSDSALPNE